MFLVLILLVGVAPAVLVYYDATERRVRHRLLWTATTAAAGLVASVVGSGTVAILYALVGREYPREES